MQWGVGPSILWLVQRLVIIWLRVGVAALISFITTSLKLEWFSEVVSRIFHLLLFLVALIKFNLPGNVLVLVGLLCGVVIVLNYIILSSGKIGVGEYGLLPSFETLLSWLCSLATTCYLGSLIRLWNERQVQARSFASVLILKAADVRHIHRIERGSPTWSSTRTSRGSSRTGCCCGGSSSFLRSSNRVVLWVLPHVTVLIRDSVCLKFASCRHICWKKPSSNSLSPISINNALKIFIRVLWSLLKRLQWLS